MTHIRVRGVQSGRPRIRPRTVVTAVLVIVLVVAAVTQRDQIARIIQVMARGATLPLVVAFALEGCRILFHALAYTRSFRVIGTDVPLRATVPAWFKAVFMNTVVSSGGVSGMAAVVDAARSRGVAVGSATSATVFTQTCFYSASFLIILVGFCVMGASGTLSVRDVLVGSVIGVSAAVFLGLLLLGHLKPSLLQRGARAVERLVVRLCRLVRLRRVPKPWADGLVRSFSTAASELSRRPRKALGVFGTMVIAMGFDMLAFMAAGFAFGITRPDALLGGYVTALVFNSFTVTPGGVGVVETLASAVLAGYGYPGTLAVSAVLTYRALMYWIPFAVGGVMMRATGAFSLGGATGEGDAAGPSRVRLSLRERLYDLLASRLDRRTALCALLVLAAAVFEIICAALPPDAAMVAVLASYIPASGAINPVVVIVVGYFLMLLVPGLLMHDQGCWLLSVVALLLLGVTSAFSGHGLVGIVLVIVALVALIVWQGCFTAHTFLRRLGRLLGVLLYAMAIVVAYALIGMVALRGSLVGEPGVLGALGAGVQVLAGMPDGVAPGSHAMWFVASVRAMTATLMACLVFVIGLRMAGRIRAYRRPEAREIRAFNRAEARRAAELRKADRAARRAEKLEALGLRRRGRHGGSTPADEDDGLAGEDVAPADGDGAAVSVESGDATADGATNTDAPTEAATPEMPANSGAAEDAGAEVEMSEVPIESDAFGAEPADVPADSNEKGDTLR